MKCRHRRWSGNIPGLVMGLLERPADLKRQIVSVGQAATWQRQPALPLRPAEGSEPSEDLTWAEPAAPAAP